MDEVRTIYITGFPADVKERELNNLLRFLPGYEASQMHWKNGQAQGFAMFATGALAANAIDAVCHLCFDDVSILRAEMARKNMYLKEDGPTTKRPRTEFGDAPPAAPAPVGGPKPFAPAPTHDNPPCNTLFVANLNDSVMEPDLENVFMHLPGFRLVKIVRGPRSVSGFVDFMDIPSAMSAHQSQQGAAFPFTNPGGMRIQYAKNPLGRKRTVDGVFHPEGSAPGGI
jgi:hypothetical protein